MEKWLEFTYGTCNNNISICLFKINLQFYGWGKLKDEFLSILYMCLTFEWLDTPRSELTGTFLRAPRNSLPCSDASVLIVQLIEMPFL